MRKTPAVFAAVATVLILVLVIRMSERGIVDYFMFPGAGFSAAEAPPAPDYSLSANWAALPDRVDGADTLPPGTGAEDRQAQAAADLFFLYPTSYLLGRDWNAATDAFLANWITDNGVLPQQAGAFNGAAKVYAPRYRQVSQGAQMQQQRPDDKRQALALAFGDLTRAFDHYLEHFKQLDGPRLADKGTTAWNLLN